MKIICVFLITVFFVCANANEINPDAYENKEVGIYIEKPSKWYFASQQSTVDNRSMYRLKDEEFQKKYFNNAKAPLVVIIKSEDPTEVKGVIPTTQVLMVLSPDKSITSEQVLDISIQTFQSNVPSFRYIENITPMKISGLDGARAIFSYSMDTNLGYKIDVKTRTYIAKRGKYFINVSQAGPLEGDDVSDVEFKKIIDSLRIDK